MLLAEKQNDTRLGFTHGEFLCAPEIQGYLGAFAFVDGS